MAWELQGQLIENCSCNMFCPCWFGNPELMVMDREWCQGALVLRIASGSLDGTDLGGRTVSLGVHFPGPTMFDGDGTGRVYIDGEATEEQRTALESIMHGGLGGPPEALAGLISDWLPTETVQFAIDEDGEAIAVRVGDAGGVSSRPVRDMEGNGFTIRGGGFVGGFGLEAAELAAPTNGAEWSGGLPQEGVAMRSGARGAFTWSG